MEIVLFTDKPSVEKQFDLLKRSRGFTFLHYPRSELRKAVKNFNRGTFLYLDISGLKDEERSKMLHFMARLKEFRYGIIDTEGAIQDVATLLHDGASDYVNKSVIREKISIKRVRKAVQIHDLGPVPQGKAVKTANGQAIIPTGSDWSTVRQGQEYTFGMMYIELDDQSTMKNKMSDSQINTLMSAFKRYIERSIAPLKGRIWIWNDFGGLILFPFDGKRCDAPVVCFRLMLSRMIFSVEDTGLDRIFSYRIAFHIGNTVFKRKGETGTIVSTSINTIFHLGQKYLHPGQFYITEDALRFTPEGLKKSFLPVGNYEGHDILRMKLPL